MMKIGFGDVDYDHRGFILLLLRLSAAVVPPRNSRHSAHGALMMHVLFLTRMQALGDDLGSKSKTGPENLSEGQRTLLFM